MDILAALKIDLGITTKAYDERLMHYIEAAEQEITREGVTLNESDSHLIVMVAAWLWRRRDSGQGMPRMIRWALNNRVFQEHMESDDNG